MAASTSIAGAGRGVVDERGTEDAHHGAGGAAQGLVA